LSPVGFDKVNLTAVADEYFYRETLTFSSSPKFRIHLLILRIEPDELPLLYPAIKEYTRARQSCKGLTFSLHSIIADPAYN